jgi:hypothetical protein
MVQTVHNRRSAMTAVRRPAVAGRFYPGNPRALRTAIADLLAGAEGEAGAPPKAVIVPHAGYVYSGPVAATAYARLAPLRGLIGRVVLLGPAHYVPIQGIAAPTSEAFDTPLGRIPIDREAVATISDLPGVSVFDLPHLEEHSLEVQLPFLQAVLGDFTLVPLVVGFAAPEEVAAVLARLWGGPETLIVVSSDLSHYHDYQTARRRDAATAAAIERCEPSAIGPEDACGCVAVSGLLLEVHRRGLSAQRLDLRNSGDTAGPRDRVVGYGA